MNLSNNRQFLSFYLDESKNDLIVKSYIELTTQVKNLYIEKLKLLGIYDKVCKRYKFNQPKKYNNTNMTLKEKIFDKKLVEPNLWNCLEDYYQYTLSMFPDSPIPINILYEKQNIFLNNFLISDLICFLKDGKEIWRKIPPIATSSKHYKKLLEKENLLKNIQYSSEEIESIYQEQIKEKIK